MSLHTTPSSLVQRFASLAPHVNANACLVHRGRTLTADLVVVIGTARFLLRIHQGEVVELTQRFALFHPCALFVQGTAEAWERLWEEVPPPGWHDLFALHKRGEMVIEGDTRLLFSHLQYLKDVLEMPRHVPADA